MTTVYPFSPDFLKTLDQWESRIPWMYLDSAKVPNVTVGVGHVVFTAGEAAAIFGKDQAAAEWEAVRKQPGGLSANTYAHCTTLRLSDPQIDEIRDSDLENIVIAYDALVPGWREWPQGVQEALLDLGFNCGPSIVHAPPPHGFPKLMKALYEKDWEKAAAESMRTGPGTQAARNLWVRRSILSAIPAVTT